MPWYFCVRGTSRPRGAARFLVGVGAGVLFLAMGTKPEDAGMVVVPPIIVFVEVTVLGGDGGAVTVEVTCLSGQNYNGDGRSS